MSEGSLQSPFVRKSSLCTLQCLNGGVCEISVGYEQTLAMIQSGHMIQACLCAPGFTGIACEVALQKCSSMDQCQDEMGNCSSSGYCSNHCYAANQVSPFASAMCQRPVTEYCGTDHLRYFCTNGGKCRADIMAARIAPGDTSKNILFESEGCLCPVDFDGPHCEVLKQQQVDEDDMMQSMTHDEFSSLYEQQLAQQEGGIPRQSGFPMLAWVPVGLLVANMIVTALFLMLRRRRSKQRQAVVVSVPEPTKPLRESPETTECSFSDVGVDLSAFVIHEEDLEY